MLTDLEYRVWTQYLLSADDFGVMHATSHALQNDNLCLAGKPQKAVTRCLEQLITCGLVRRFEHQGQPYVFQGDWQRWQKVEYPRATINPCPPLIDLDTCDAATQGLFLKHPGGQRRTARPKDDPNDSGRTSLTHAEDVPSTRAGAPAKRLTANGQRLTAHGSEGGLGETDPPMDVWTRELVELYPPQGRCAANLVEPFLFVVLMEEVGVSPRQAWEALKARLEGHKRSHQWRVKQMIPRLDRYLRDGAHLQELPEHPVSTLVNDKTVRTQTSGAAFVAGGRDGAE